MQFLNSIVSQNFNYLFFTKIAKNCKELYQQNATVWIFSCLSVCWRGCCNSISNWGIVLKDYKTYFEIVFLQDAKSLSLRNFDMCGCQTYVNHVIFGIWLVALTQWEFPTCFVWWLSHSKNSKVPLLISVDVLKSANLVHKRGLDNSQSHTSVVLIYWAYVSKGPWLY